MGVAYATRTDLTNLSIRAEALQGVSTAVQDIQLEAASRLFDLRGGRHFSAIDPANIPLEVKKWVCDIAAYECLILRGVSPDDKVIEHFAMRKRDALKNIELLGAGDISPTTGDATPTVDEGAPAVYSDEPRGWVQ
jgi:hypothetical protein